MGPPRTGGCAGPPRVRVVRGPPERGGGGGGVRGPPENGGCAGPPREERWKGVPNSDDEEERFLDADYDYVPKFHTDANPLGVIANLEFDEPMPVQNDGAASQAVCMASDVDRVNRDVMNDASASSSGANASAGKKHHATGRKISTHMKVVKKRKDAVTEQRANIKRTAACEAVAHIETPSGTALVATEPSTSSSSVPAVSQPDARPSMTEVPARRQRRRSADISPLDGLTIRRTSVRNYLSPEQFDWRDEWLHRNGFDRQNCRVSDAEQCIADGIRGAIWGLSDTPTVKGIVSRAKKLERADKRRSS